MNYNEAFHLANKMIEREVEDPNSPMERSVAMMRVLGWFNEARASDAPAWSERVVSWAYDRNLINGSDPKSQLAKLVEELGELASGICKQDRELAKDSIGDCAVVLCIIAEQLQMDFDECCEHAWSEIKDRKGRMVDGVFVKEEDLDDQ